MAVVPITTRIRRIHRFRRGGLGDLADDMHNAAMNATPVNDFPAHAPYLAAVRWAGKTLINMNNPAEMGGDDTANWVEYTGAFYGKTEQQKTYYWGGQGAPVAIPGWTPEMAVKDPQGYQQALAEWQRANAENIARETASIRTFQDNEFNQGEIERAARRAAEAAADKAAAEASKRASGGTWDGTTTVTTTTLPPNTGGSGGGGSTSIPTYVPPASSGPGTGGGGPGIPQMPGNDLADSNGGGMPAPSGDVGGMGGGDGGGGGAAPSGGLSPLVLGGLAIAAYMFMRKR